jgi:hypothetical protein
MQFNVAQLEGLARVSDNLLTSMLIGAVVALFGHTTLTNTEIALLLIGAPFVALFSYSLRRK